LIPDREGFFLRCKLLQVIQIQVAFLAAHRYLISCHAVIPMVGLVEVQRLERTVHLHGVQPFILDVPEVSRILRRHEFFR